MDLKTIPSKKNNGTTKITVELDITEDFLDYMNQTYPKALHKLKEICEKSNIRFLKIYLYLRRKIKKRYLALKSTQN